MHATVARAAVVGLTIFGLSGCQSGAGGWSWPWRSAQNSQAYPSTADAAGGGISYPNQAAAPNVQLPTANATPYGASAPGAAQGGPSYEQASRQPQSYGTYPEAPTSYSGAGASGYPSSSAGNYAGSAATGYPEATGGYANPAASSYGAYPSTTSNAANAMAPQEGYYGAAAYGSAAGAAQAPTYGNNGATSSTATGAGAYPSTASSASPYASTAPAAGSYAAPASGTPAAPADYAASGALRTADNRSAPGGTRYDGGTASGPAGTGSSTYPSGSSYQASPSGSSYQPSAAAGAGSDDRYSKYGSSSPAASDSNWNQSRYPAAGAADNSSAGGYPMTAPAAGYPAQSAPSGSTGGASSEPRYRPGGTKDYLPSTNSSQGSTIPGSYGSSSAPVRPANYETTAGDTAAAAAKIPATVDRYSNAPGDDRYGGMPAVVTPPEVSVPTVGP